MVDDQIEPGGCLTLELSLDATCTIHARAALQMNLEHGLRQSSGTAHMHALRVQRLLMGTLPGFVAACLSGGSGLQAQEIRLGETRVIARSTAGQPLYEPYVAVHPTNPRHLVAAAIVAGPTGGTFAERMRRQSCAAFVSDDTGHTWRRRDFATTAAASSVAISCLRRCHVRAVGHGRGLLWACGANGHGVSNRLV